MKTERPMRVVALLLGVLVVACAGCQDNNLDAEPARYIPTDQAGPVSGVGIESQDIVMMTNKMVIAILALPSITERSEPAAVIVDAKYFKNQSSSRIDKNLITDRLRTGLSKAAAGKLKFVGREYLAAIEEEKDVEIATGGPGPKTRRKLAMPDYRLVGRISSLDKIDPSTGGRSRYHHIVFELINLKSGLLVWTDGYEFKKAGRSDVVYR